LTIIQSGTATPSVTADSIHAKSARALRAVNSGAGFAIVFLAASGAIARERIGASRQVFGPFGHVHAHANASGNGAWFAVFRAACIATNAVDAKAAQAFHAIRARRSIVFFTIAGTIAHGATHLAARRIEWFGRIRRDALNTANILRALIIVDGFVIWIDRRHDIAYGIAFDDFAIFTGLSRGQIRARGRQFQHTYGVDTRALFAEVRGRQHGAIIRFVAPDAETRSITNERVSARKTSSFIGIRRHPCSTIVLGTRIVVVRNIGIENFDDRGSGAIANDLLTITSGLIGNRSAHGGKGLSAHVVDTRPLLTIIIRRQKDAIIGNIALHAPALPIADFRLPDDTRSSLRNAWIRTDSPRTQILRARIQIIRNVGIVIERRIDSIVANMDLAIAYGLLKSRRRQPIERGKRAGTNTRITRVFSARIVVIARFYRTAFDRANARHAFSGRGTHRAHRVFTDRVMHGTAAIAPIRRARFGVIENIRVIIGGNNLPIDAIIAPTIPSDLLHQRTVGRIRPHTCIIRLTDINRARVLIVAVDVRCTRLQNVGWLGTIRIQRAW
jgi:hypothetical protein